MKHFFTPLLRWTYLGFGLFLGAYIGFILIQHTAWHKERLLRKLVLGDEYERISAASGLVQVKAQEQLLRALQSHSSEVRRVAIHSLWELWFRAAGEEAFALTQRAAEAAESERFDEAFEMLASLIARFPAFAEGWNRRAVLHWQLGQYREAIADCRRTIELNPEHFGAWQGLGLCHLSLGQFDAACQSFQRALQLNPHDPLLQKFSRECEQRHRRIQPGLTPRSADLVLAHQPLAFAA